MELKDRIAVGVKDMERYRRVGKGRIRKRMGRESYGSIRREGDGKGMGREEKGRVAW